MSDLFSGYARISKRQVDIMNDIAVILRTNMRQRDTVEFKMLFSSFIDIYRSQIRIPTIERESLITALINNDASSVLTKPICTDARGRNILDICAISDVTKLIKLLDHNPALVISKTVLGVYELESCNRLIKLISEFHDNVKIADFTKKINEIRVFYGLDKLKELERYYIKPSSSMVKRGLSKLKMTVLNTMKSSKFGNPKLGRRRIIL